jgi:acetyl esterase
MCFKTQLCRSGIFGLLVLVSIIGSPVTAQDLPFTKQPTRKEMRDWLHSLTPENRKASIRQFYEQYGRKFVERTLNQKRYAAPAQSDDDTRQFMFKQTPQRDLNLFVDYPKGWKASDKRPAIVLWHGGGFTQGNAGQFYHQANYFAERGAVCFRPEYRIRDVDMTLPHSAIEDGVSAVRWIIERAEEFGIDPDRIVVGGGSAGGSMASSIGTADVKKLADMECVGEEDNQSIVPRIAGMLLYNPFVDFFEPTSQRHIEEEMIFLGYDPEDYRALYHEISGIEKLHKKSPPSVIMFGTRDAFYVQQLRWIVKCRELGITCTDYVYKSEVHSWYNNSPHIEYTTHNANEFLISIGLLNREPDVELPHKIINPNRMTIQEDKYSNKKDWDALSKYQQYVKDHNITIIPYKHYEQAR